MAKSYHQYCPMSYALDVIGDRWTLLIVRNLMFGALRYSDLKRGLPGIASNLFVARLKEMQVNNLIEQQTLPPPANVEVYALTQRGRQLRTVIAALTDWGLPYLQPVPPEEDYVGFIPFRGYLKTFFVSQQALDKQLVCDIYYAEQHLIVKIQDGQLILRNHSDDEIDLTIVVHDLRQFIGVMNQIITIEQALESNSITVDADKIASLRDFISMFDPVPQASQS